jgi:hypothetical protein
MAGGGADPDNHYTPGNRCDHYRWTPVYPPDGWGTGPVENNFIVVNRYGAMVYDYS